MSKEKQIIGIKECIDAVYGADCAYYDVDGFAIANEIYTAGYRKQEWISVEERLPKQWESVLVCCGDEDEIGTDFIASNGRWYEHIHDTITHWMPLPEPQKMKGGAE